MNKTNTTIICFMLLGLLLSGCTINIYENSATKPSTSTQSSPEHTLQQVGSLESKTNVELTGTVDAAAIMSIQTTPSGALVSSDDSITLEIMLKVDAYVSCFYQQDNGEIIKLFPNRVIPRYRLSTGQVLRIPGANGFRVLTPLAETKEKFMCLASAEDVTPNLPLEFQANTFQQVPVENFDSLFQVFRSNTSENLIARVLEVPVYTTRDLSRSLSQNTIY